MSMDELTLARMKKKREEAIAHSKEAPGKFLSAWIAGIRVVGENYFTHNPSFVEPAEILQDVSDKWQVIPNNEYIGDNISVLSSGEATLLAVMCSFYNSEWGGMLMRDLGINGMADVSAKLDLGETKIVADLLLNYSGW